MLLYDLRTEALALLIKSVDIDNCCSLLRVAEDLSEPGMRVGVEVRVRVVGGLGVV